MNTGRIALKNESSSGVLYSRDKVGHFNHASVHNAWRLQIAWHSFIFSNSFYRIFRHESYFLVVVVPLFCLVKSGCWWNQFFLYWWFLVCSAEDFTLLSQSFFCDYREFLLFLGQKFCEYQFNKTAVSGHLFLKWWTGLKRIPPAGSYLLPRSKNWPTLSRKYSRKMSEQTVLHEILTHAGGILTWLHLQ